MEFLQHFFLFPFPLQLSLLLFFLQLLSDLLVDIKFQLFLQTDVSFSWDLTLALLFYFISLIE